MELKFREFGKAGRPPLVILHGLLGSSRNWQMAAKELEDCFHVFCLDLRNHGESPWAEPHSYEAMVDDLQQWMESRLDGKPVLMGHSMGGKLAMKFACEFPDLIRKLIVVDISPRLYPKTHDDEFIGMREVKRRGATTRGKAEIILAAYISDWAKRKFLLTNLIRKDGEETLEWQINLDGIEVSLREIEKSPLSAGQCYEGDSLFVMGGKSSYFSSDDVSIIREHFPTSGIEVMSESGHNPHFECRERFAQIVRDFAIV